MAWWTQCPQDPSECSSSLAIRIVGTIRPNPMARVSNFLSLILRHQPQRIGLSLDAGGWANVDELTSKAQAKGVKIDREGILEAVRNNDKQRFALSEDGSRIRANQGHSIPVELGLLAITPPDVLFHGTAQRFLESILATGLEPRNRQHVHLSADHATAVTVGTRHGKPVVLRVDAAAMAAAKFSFYRSDNGVWLTGSVPPDFLAPM